MFARLPRIFSYKSQSSECMRFGSSGFISGQVSVHTGSGPQPISLHAVPMMRESLNILYILFVSRYPTSPSEDRPIVGSIARSLDRLLGRSLDRSVDRSVAQSVARSLGRSFGRSVSRSVHLPPCLSPSPYLVFPHPFPCISHPSPPQSGFVDWNKTFHSHAHCA